MTTMIKRGILQMKPAFPETAVLPMAWSGSGPANPDDRDDPDDSDGPCGDAEDNGRFAEGSATTISNQSGIEIAN